MSSLLIGNVRGPQGVKGDTGTIAVGTTTTLPAGSSATVTNSGTSTAAIFDFGIPKGDKGDTVESADEMDITDVEGLVGTAGDTTDAQTLVNEIADRVANRCIPAGGAANNVLAKDSLTDYDAEWKTLTEVGAVDNGTIAYVENGTKYTNAYPNTGTYFYHGSELRKTKTAVSANQDITDSNSGVVTNLGTEVSALNQSIELQVTLYGTNPYIDTVTGIRAFKTGNMLIAEFGFAPKADVSAQTDFENVAYITGWTAQAQTAFGFSNPTNPSQVIVCIIRHDGIIRLYTGTGFSRTNIRGNIATVAQFKPYT